MPQTRTDQLLEILQEHFNPREEGWLWLATFIEGYDGGLLNQVEGAYEDVEATAHGLARLVCQGEADHAYVALCRDEGRPTESDRELWRALRRLIGSAVLIDMVVFNAEHAWSMRAEDAAAA